MSDRRARNQGVPQVTSRVEPGRLTAMDRVIVTAQHEFSPIDGYFSADWFGREGRSLFARGWLFCGIPAGFAAAIVWLSPISRSTRLRPVGAACA
jgi:hypothetical protein